MQDIKNILEQIARVRIDLKNTILLDQYEKSKDLLNKLTELNKDAMTLINNPDKPKDAA
jgi:hypothetical protein